MMTKQQVLYWFIWLVLFTTAIIEYNTNSMSSAFITLFAFVVFVFVSFYFHISNGLKWAGLTHVHYLYASLSAFACGWVYYFIGKNAVYSTISAYSARFLDSVLYGKAVALSILAFLIYILGVQIGDRPSYEDETINDFSNEQTWTEKTLATIGIIAIAFTFLMFLMMIVIGRIRLSMSYSQFMDMTGSIPFYSYMLLFYEFGICFVFACGSAKQLKLGIILYLLVALVFFVTGNKGEVLYAALACLGIARCRGYRISVKLIFIVGVLIFVLIPSITALRGTGVVSRINEISYNFTGFFVEVGTQLRCTVYMLEQFASKTRDYIWGFSYYNPIVNIIDTFIPFSIRLIAPASFDFKTAFATMGFNQIAEGYANFGAFGSCLYFFVTGYFLSKNESKVLTKEKLAYIGSICMILINVSRNKFAFCFGHIFIVSVIYLVVHYFGRRGR